MEAAAQPGLRFPVGKFQRVESLTGDRRREPQRAPRIGRALVATVSALLTVGSSLSDPPLDSRSWP